jgi:hypothetical protein
LEIIKREVTQIAIINQSRERTRLDTSTLDSKTIKAQLKTALSENKEIRWYYLPNTNFEVIKTAIPPKYEQQFHRHMKYMEAMIVLKGNVVVIEDNQGKIIEQTLGSNDFVFFSQKITTFHTVKNSSKKYAYILTFKFKGSKKKDGTSFINDWFAKQ